MATDDNLSSVVDVNGSPALLIRPDQAAHALGSVSLIRKGRLIVVLGTGELSGDALLDAARTLKN
jgi:hypothetical protein